MCHAARLAVAKVLQSSTAGQHQWCHSGHSELTGCWGGGGAPIACSTAQIASSAQPGGPPPAMVTNTLLFIDDVDLGDGFQINLFLEWTSYESGVKQQRNPPQKGPAREDVRLIAMA